MKCSTEASTGVLFSDLRYVDRPGACIVARCMVTLSQSCREILQDFDWYTRNVGWWGSSAMTLLVQMEL